MEAIVCASCPERHHDRVAALCRQHGIQKAFGKAGDMVNDLSGKDWIPKWEAKVVTATVTKAQTLDVPKAKILCIAGGRHCDDEMARQPKLVQAIKKEMEDPNFRVSVEWLEVEDFVDRYPEKRPAGGGGAASPPGGAAGAGAGGYPSGAERDRPGGGGGGGAGRKDKGPEDSKRPGCWQDQTKPNQQDSNQTPSLTPCRHFAQGNCKFGNKCTYLHQNSKDVKDHGSDKAGTPASGKAAGKGKQSPKGQGSGGGGGETPSGQKEKAGGKDHGSDKASTPASGKAAGKGKQSPKGQGSGSASETPTAQKEKAGGKDKDSQKKSGNGDASSTNKTPPSTNPKASNQGARGQDAPPGQKPGGEAGPPTPCRHFAQGSCKFGKACTFLHQTPTQNQTPCSYFAQGYCKYGSGCAYLHQMGKDTKVGASGNSGKEAGSGKKKQQGAESKKASARALPCLECGRKFKDWDDMKSKHWLCKGREPLFVCTQCNKSFDADTACAQHQAATGHKGCARANDSNDPVWECEQCKKTFATEEACEQHQRMVGHGNTPACAVCNKVFEFEKSLLQHQRSTKHTGVVWLMHDNGVRSDDSDESSGEDMADAKIACSCGRLFYDLHAAVTHRAATGHYITSLNPNIYIGPTVF